MVQCSLQRKAPLLVAAFMAALLLFAVFPSRLTAEGPGPEPRFFPLFGIQLPREDVEGRDLEAVPRYRPSVRTRYDEQREGDGLSVEITYYTRDDVERVRKFYLERMKERKWRLFKEEAVPGMTFLNVAVEASRLLEFRPAGCTGAGPCAQEARITIGGFRIGEDSYAVIEIAYDKYSPAPSRVEERKEGPRAEPVSVVPPSEFGKRLNEFVISLLSVSEGPKRVVLTSYNEIEMTGALTVHADYRVSPPVADHAAAAHSIRQGLLTRGISPDLASLHVSGTSATVTAGGPALEIGGKVIAMIEFSLNKGSDVIAVMVMTTP